MPFYGRKLIRVIGGKSEPDENLKAYLWRVSEITGIGFRSLERAWKLSDGYLSKETEKALQEAAQQKAKNDDDERIAWLESHIAHLEEVDADMYRPDIDAAREFLARYRNYGATRVFATVPSGIGNDREDD